MIERQKININVSSNMVLCEHILITKGCESTHKNNMENDLGRENGYSLVVKIHDGQIG